MSKRLLQRKKQQTPSREHPAQAANVSLDMAPDLGPEQALQGQGLMGNARVIGLLASPGGAGRGGGVGHGGDADSGEAAAGGFAMVQLSEDGGSGSTPADPGATFNQATSGGGGEVPYRAEMEAVFGQDFSSVQSYAGRNGEMSSLGAEAAASGEQVAFAAANPSRETVAHELTHVVQQRSGQPAVQGASTSGSSVLSSPGDASEREARSLAPLAAAGTPVTVGQSTGGSQVSLNPDGGGGGGGEQAPSSGEGGEQSLVQQVREALDDDQEEQAITLMGTLTGGQANEVLNGMRDLAVSAFGNDEMGRAAASLVRRGGNLGKALEWMFEEGTNSELLFTTVRACTDATQKQALATPTWRDRFSSELGNDDMNRMVALLDFTLAQRLEWMFYEGTDWASLQAAISGCSDIDQCRALATATWKERFSGELGNDEMAEAVALLHFDLADQLEWMFYEGTDWDALQTIIGNCIDMNQRKALATATWKERFSGELGNVDMAELVTTLGFDLVDQLDWMLYEGTDWATALAKATACTDTGQATALSEAGWRSRLADEFGPAHYWRLLLVVNYGDASAIPAPAASVLQALENGSSAAEVRAIISGMNDADWTTLGGILCVREVLQLALDEAEEYAQILRVLDEGLVSEDTNVEGDFEEELLADSETAGGPFDLRTFSASTDWDVAYFRTKLQVTIRINLQAADAGAQAEVAAARGTCDGIIRGAWNGKFSITNPERTIPLEFNPVFTGGGAHQEVNLRSGEPEWPGYNMGNWYAAVPSNANSLNACAHEFGHMLGNPDEYWRPASDYQPVVGVDPTTDPNASAETDSAGVTRYTNTTGIMGSGGHNGTIDPRHVDRFVTWVNQNRRKNPETNAFAEDAFTLV